MENFEIGDTVYFKNTSYPMTLIAWWCRNDKLPNVCCIYQDKEGNLIEIQPFKDALTKTPYTPPQGVVINGTILESEGKTLRDEIALGALQGMLANPQASGSEQDYAKWAYQYADAMLEARKKQG